MFFTSTRTVIVLALLLHNTLAFSQNPNCPTPTFFKTSGAGTHTEYGTVLTRSGDGNLYLAGRNSANTFIQKINLAGDVIWMREFRIGPFEPITPIQIFEDSEGMIVGCGTQTQFAGATRGFAFRYDPVQNLFLWAHPITSNNPMAAGILEKTPGGSYIYYENSVFFSGETDIEILDLERATGNIIPAFASRYEHISYDVLVKIVSVGGSLYGLGSVESRDSFDNAARRLMLARFDPVNGMPIWAQLSHDDTTAQTDFLARDLVADGDALIAAYVVDEDINDDPSTQPNIVHLQKTDLDGNILWIKRYELSTSILRVISVSDGYVLSGQRTFNSRYFVFKVNKDGDFVWGRNLDYGPASTPNTLSHGPDQSVAVADSLYFTGLATTGFGDVFLWKMLGDGTMTDSCGFVDTLPLQVTDIQNPIRTPINLQQLITTAVATNATAPWTTNTLSETLVCPDCTVPDPCPEDNDFVVDITNISCSGGFVNMTFSICDLDGGTLPDLDITFYDANPYTDAADQLGTYNYNSSNPDSCATVQLANLESQFGAGAVQNGFQIFAVVNDPGSTNTPFTVDDFPLSGIEECNYFNNLDSISVQLPAVPTLNLGVDQVICSNETATLDAGAGFFRYQWSNGATTQATTVNFGGQYRVTVTDHCGFRQNDTINIQVTPLTFIQESGFFCPGKSVTVHGFTFDQPGTFQRTIPGLNNDCDTSATFTIDVLPYEERIEVINFCPFETVTINGVVYEDSGLVRDTVPSTSTCDTIVFYFLNQQPLPFRTYLFEICPGDSVVFNGQVYFQPIGFTDTLYSTGIGCDTTAYVTIDYLPIPELLDTIQFCPGASVQIGGQFYNQPGDVSLTIPSLTGGCDTLLTYTLQFSSLPTKSETLEFCAGGSITLGGQTYSQPTTVTLTIAGAGNDCDTLVTYTLQYLTPPPSTLNVVCPTALTVVTTPGTGPTPVNYSLPLVTSDCICPGNALTLTNGPASGSIFAVGNTQVCYSAQDSCSSIANCCFTVTVREELPCDTKVSGCVQYDLLSITANSQQQRSYRIRVTNNCANKLIYTAIQLPNGLSAVSPASLSIYTSPNGRQYAVRNPNFSPFYSIRFKPTSDGIVNGQSDEFEYTLPAQANPTYINITSRLETQSFYAAHLNTFNCPIGITPTNNRNEAVPFIENVQTRMLLFPNPTSGELFADFSQWQGEDLNVQILDSRGMRAQSLRMNASSEAQAIPLSSQLPSGLYFLEIVTEHGEREVGSFVLER
ncbi:MAG: HYR domain-containing protein [Saprospiraceae bacterium]|nr:HYR domain-containing protein [Saprospiraceae bacterium]